MLRGLILVVLALGMPMQGGPVAAKGELLMPERYREWVFLTIGVEMSYSPSAAMAGHSMFDNVFVNPTSYRSFQQTGTCPDKTTMVLGQSRSVSASGCYH